MLLARVSVRVRGAFNLVHGRKIRVSSRGNTDEHEYSYVDHVHSETVASEEVKIMLSIFLHAWIKSLGLDTVYRVATRSKVTLSK